MDDDTQKMIEQLAERNQDMKDRVIREFGLDEDEADLVIWTLNDSPMDASPETWESVWTAVRKDWADGERTSERLAALVLQYLAVAVMKQEG